MAKKKGKQIKVTNFMGTVRGFNVKEGEKHLGSIAKVTVPAKGKFVDSTLFITGKGRELRTYRSRSEANKRFPRLSKIVPKLR